MGHRIGESHDLAAERMLNASTFSPSAGWVWGDSRLPLKSLPSLTSAIWKILFTCNPENGKPCEGSSEVILSVAAILQVASEVAGP